jgi:ribosomal-protein-serine acetyltransferase
MCSINEINWDVPKANLGYWIRTSQGGQGFMAEAVTSLTDFAHKIMQITRVSIVCHDENIKSAQLAERCGFNLEGKSLGYQRKPGQVNPSWWRIYASVRF